MVQRSLNLQLRPNSAGVTEFEAQQDSVNSPRKSRGESCFAAGKKSSKSPQDQAIVLLAFLSTSLTVVGYFLHKRKHFMPRKQ
jgi:hypothetical protein